MMYCPSAWGGSWLYQTRKISAMYAYVTISAVSRISFDMASKCFSVK